MPNKVDHCKQFLPFDALTGFKEAIETINNNIDIINKKELDFDYLDILNNKVSNIKKNDLYIQDLGSTNGTYINGKRIRKNESVKIDESSEIKFGKVNISVV